MLVHSYGVRLVKMPPTVSLFLASSKARNQPLRKEKPAKMSPMAIKRGESVENDMKKPLEHDNFLKVIY